MNYEDDEYRDLLAQWGLQGSAPVQESMRGRRKTRNPSTDDKKVRRQNGRRTAAETFDAGGEVQKRADLVSALNKAASLAEQARLLDEIAKFDSAKQATAAQARELDFATAVVRDTLTPVRVHEHHTASTDWIGYEQDIPSDWQTRVVAEAAAWYSRVPDFVRADGEEFGIQAEGKARQFAGQFGIQAAAARQTFTQYANFLRTQAASGLDQIQQTVAPDGVTNKTTPLPTEVFDNFAPDVDPINAGVSGTEDSNRAPLIQEIVGGGSGMDNGAPEKPSEHDEGPMGVTGSLISAPSVAIGGYGYSMDDFRREASQGKAEGGRAAAAPVKTAAKCKNCKCDLSSENRGAKGRCINCEGRNGGKASAKEAASGLDQIQQTVDPNNAPKPTPLPPEVAFPLDNDMQQEWTTNGTGQAAPGKAASVRKQADEWGASDAPHGVPQPDVANTPATRPPYPAQTAGGAPAGAADATAGDKPSFSDNSSTVPPQADQYAQGYDGVNQSAGAPTEEVVGAGLPPATKVSSLIVTAKEKGNPDFRKGYGYASRWTPGTRLVATGSSAFEAGLYAGISDNPAHQRAFVDAHKAAAAQYPKLGERAARHRAITVRIASKNEVPTNGLYVQAATSIELNTTAPNTTPAADGSTPINGPGRPGPLDGQQEAAAPGGPAPYNGAEPFGSPVVPNGAQTAEVNPADALLGGGGMSTPQQVQAAFRRRVQAGLLAERKEK